uniref:Thioredoxin domain containing 16 n=1 Tax=Pavo cristatus TaxID=9049 RepID=A0A8C9EUN1_PAVCR
MAWLSFGQDVALSFQKQRAAIRLWCLNAAPHSSVERSSSPLQVKGYFRDGGMNAEDIPKLTHRITPLQVLVPETTSQGAISNEPDVSSAQLLFCHCQQATDLAQPCRRTPLEQDLTVLNIHRHLKLMGAPLVTEVAEDPEKVSTVHLQLGLPLVFILSQKETYEADRRTAEFLAWKLLGKAGVGVPIKYLVLEDTEEVVTLVEDRSKVKQIQENEDEDEEDEDEKENDNQDMQDDQVVEAVSRDKKRELPLDQILTLTEETFHSAMLEAAQTVVLFYASWEAVSLAVLQSYTEVAGHLKGTQGILFSRVNCWDWPGVCTVENVTQFPTIKIYKKGGQPITYNGMLGTEELSSFIVLSQVSCPLKLATIDEAERYLRGELPSELSSYHHSLVLGVFSTATSKGEFGWIFFRSHKYAVSPPALLLARSSGQSVEGISLSEQSAQDIVQMIRYELLDVFPEITVQNLPRYLQLRKPFLILFSDGDLGQIESKEMLKLAKGRSQQAFVSCWLNLKNTPVGRGVLKAYFATIPSLPALVWVNLHAGGQVFKFPSEQPITEMNILSWLEKLKAGLEIPSSKCLSLTLEKGTVNVPPSQVRCSHRVPQSWEQLADSLLQAPERRWGFDLVEF